MLATWGYNTGDSGPAPGPPWQVLTSTNDLYQVSRTALSSVNTFYFLVALVLTSDGTAYNPI